MKRFLVYCIVKQMRTMKQALKPLRNMNCEWLSRNRVFRYATKLPEACMYGCNEIFSLYWVLKIFQPCTFNLFPKFWNLQVRDAGPICPLRLEWNFELYMCTSNPLLGLEKILTLESAVNYETWKKFLHLICICKPARKKHAQHQNFKFLFLTISHEKKVKKKMTENHLWLTQF